jgi:hypothetical protein
MARAIRPRRSRAALGAALRSGTLALACAAPAAAGPQAAVTDPFDAGLRWEEAPPSGDVDLPRSVAFSAGGDLLLAGGSLADAAVELLGGQLEPGGAPMLADDPLWSGSIGPIEVLAGPDPRFLYALGQFEAPGGLKRTRLARYDAYVGAQPGAWSPVWSIDLPYDSQGSARWSGPEQSREPWIALHDGNTDQLRALRIDPLTGAVASDVLLPGGLPAAAALFDDGARFAVAHADRVEVLDVLGGTQATLQLPAAVSALAAGAQDDALWIASAGRVERWTADSANLWSVNGSVFANAFDVPTALDVSADGNHAVAGWWNAATGRAVRFAHLEFTGGALASADLISHNAPTSSFQDFPVAVDVSDDGRRAAAGRWGSGNALTGLGPGPEAYLFDLEQNELLLGADLSGSVMDVAVDASGRRLAVAHKSLHANQFGTTGSVRLYATGEGQLALDRTARPGVTLEARLNQPGATSAWLLLGVPAPLPVALPGMQGELQLDLAKSLWILPAAPDAAGQSQVDLTVPANPSLVGLAFGLQAASHDGTDLRLGAELLRPPVL